jgi:hypothetical protein
MKMKGQIAIAIAVTLAGILTFGMIHAATHAASFEVVSPSTYGLQNVSHRAETAVLGYDGLFVRIMVAIWSGWGRVHGFAQLTHIDAFGDFYVRFVWLVCPALGLIMFCFASSQQIQLQLWRSPRFLSYVLYHRWQYSSLACFFYSASPELKRRVASLSSSL